MMQFMHYWDYKDVMQNQESFMLLLENFKEANPRIIVFKYSPIIEQIDAMFSEYEKDELKWYYVYRK